LAHFADTHHHPSALFVKPIEACLGDDKCLIESFLNGLRQIHLEHKPMVEVDEIFLKLAS
jgi:hypothetical protein